MATTAQQRLWLWGGLSLALHGLLLAGLSRSHIEPARGDPAPSFQIQLASLPVPPSAPARPGARSGRPSAHPAQRTPAPHKPRSPKQASKQDRPHPARTRTTAHAQKAKPVPRAERQEAVRTRPQPAPVPHPAAANPPAPQHKGAKSVNKAPATGEPSSPTKQRAASAPAPVTAPLPRLYRLLHAAIERHKHYPLFARRLDQQGKTRVAFRLKPDGAVQKVHIVTSSGYRTLDHAAVDAVTGIAPFDPARRYLEHDRNFEVEIVFQSY